MNKDLNEVLNYMKRYVENIYAHYSEPMLNWKDLKLVLDEIERLNNIIKEVREYITSQKLHKIQDTTGGLTYQERKLLEILDKGKE